MLIRGSSLVGVVYLAATAAILLLIQQPETPLLRYAVLALPVVAASLVMVEWYEARAPGAVPLCRQESPPNVIGTKRERAA